MATKRLEGSFSVKESEARKYSIVLVSGPGLSVSFELKANATLESAHELAAQMNRQIVSSEIEWVPSRRFP
jgi:hypothetical protein